MNYWDYFIAEKQKQYGELWNASDLDPRFIPFFFNQKRIKVSIVYVDGIIGHLTGVVGITTGWKPSFLLKYSARSYGSSVLLSPDYKIIGVKSFNGRKYESYVG